MFLQTGIIQLHHIYCDIGAVIGNTLVVHGKIREYQSKSDRAFSLAQTLHMMFFYRFVQTVNDFL